MAWSQHSRIMDANTQHRLKNEQPLGTEFSKGVKEVVGMIPEDNPVINTVGAALGGFADQWSQTMPGRMEDAALDWVGKQAPKINVDPLAATMLVGMVLPGPGEMNVAKRAVRTGRLLNAVDQNSVVKPAQRLLDIEAENARLAARYPKQSSAIATVTSDIDAKKAYGPKKDPTLEIPKEIGTPKGSPMEIKGVSAMPFHHELIKDYFSSYVETARRIGNPEDVINLDRIAKKYGFGLGDYAEAGKYRPKIAHDMGHDWALKEGIQPDARGFGPDLATEKARISKYTDIKELTEDFENAIKEIGIPMRDEMDSLADAYGRIEHKKVVEFFNLKKERGLLRKKRIDLVKEGKSTKELDVELKGIEDSHNKLKKELQTEVTQIQDDARGAIESKEDLAIERQMDLAANQGLFNSKKTKPTINTDEWSELRKRNIPIDVKLYGKSEWKVGDAKVTWYPDPDDPLKGRGQIDILDQASNTKPKGVKALIKDFNDAIKEFPSGTKVELNPMWKDAKRRSIYENYVFKNNPNIKPNPDDTLGWIYTAP